MHLSSLPGPYGIGTMGRSAYRFVDFLQRAGQTWWQLLPIGPTSFGDSPYQSFSSVAGNPYFIDLDLLEQEGLSAQVILDSHAHMERYAQAETVDCVVFNFGRLPGGDPRIFTRAESSVAAIGAGLRLLRPGGVMAIALYYGGENGYEERDAVLEYLKTVDDRAYTVLCCDWVNRRGEPPMPIFLWKEP